MSRPLCAVISTVSVILLVSAIPADAFEQRGRARTDYLHLTADEFDSQLVGYGLRWRARGIDAPLATTLEMGVSGRAREDLTRDVGTRRHVDELRLTLRDLGPVTATIGRFAFGEGTGFSLIDGGQLEVRYADGLTHALAGGFAADFDEIALDSSRPVVGTSLGLRLDDWLYAHASGSYARERVAPPGRDDELSVNRDVYAATGRVEVFPSPRTWLIASAEWADRGAYALRPDDPEAWNLEDKGFSVSQLFAQAGWRPWRPLRLDVSYLRDASRFAAPDETDRFEDVSGRVRWQFWRRFRLVSRVRARKTRDNFGAKTAFRSQIGLDLADIAGAGFGVAGSYIDDRGGAYTTRALTAELGYDDRRAIYAYGGWRSTARDRDDDATSFPGSDDAPVYAYSRTVRHAAYARAGAYVGDFFGQFTADRDLVSGQLMVFTQVGVGWR